MAILVELAGEPLDVIGDLGLQRGRDHPPSALPRERIKRRADLNVVLPKREPANILHGVPSFAAFRRTVLINREGTPPSSSDASTTSGHISTADRVVDSRSALRRRRAHAVAERPRGVRRKKLGQPKSADS